MRYEPCNASITSFDLFEYISLRIPQFILPTFPKFSASELSYVSSLLRLQWLYPQRSILSNLVKTPEQLTDKEKAC